MNALEQKAITSLEVAEMMEINHWEVLRKLEGTDKIRGIIPVMTDNKIVVSDYFTESAYVDASGKENKCYLITKMGCDFLANKFTGEKGIIFTAKYVKRFDEMEDKLKELAICSSVLYELSPELQAIFAHDKKLQFIVQHLDGQEKKITDVDKDLQTFKQDMPILGIECDRITTAVKKKGVNCLGGKDSNAYQDRSLRNKVYSDIYGQLKREFGLSSYKAIKRNQTDIAVSIIEAYELPMALAEDINDLNAQMVMQ